jgi:polysaccharide chain length determinant protein (PEP-CTERM system associated)
VTALRETLAELKARQAAEIEAAKHGDPSAIAASGLSANPVYQSTQLQLNQADVDIAALRSQVAEREAKIADLRKLVNTAPEVEAAFKRLNRDYDVTRGEYQTLVERLGRTRLSDEADATGIVRFEVIDPPRASYVPVAPNRPRLIIMVLLMGLGAGLGVAYVIHQLRPVFNSSRQLTEITRLPVLGVVSMTWIERHQLAARRTAWIYGGVVAVLVVSAVLVLGVNEPAAKMVQKLIS